MKNKLVFPADRKKVAQIQKQHHFKEMEVLKWAKQKKLFIHGQAYCAEVSPSFRCSEACPGCPDSVLILARKIKAGEMPVKEDQLPLNLMRERIKLLSDLGVKQFMFIGGTIDRFPSLSEQIESVLRFGKNMLVSWFTDGIPLTDEKTAKPNDIFQIYWRRGWLKQVSTHLSLDYPYSHNLFARTPWAPSKSRRIEEFRKKGEYSRYFKSHYGALCAKNLIAMGAYRVFLNMTISPRNIDKVWAVYQQVAALEKYARKCHSPTKVHFTFSPWIWRPHQTRGDDLQDCRASLGLQLRDAEKLNQVMGKILALEYQRISVGKPRILATSSGFANFFSDAQYNNLMVEQDLPYSGGRPEFLQIMPNGDLKLDPMFWGPELAVVRNIFSYRDRDPRKNYNPFVRFQPKKLRWFPNLISVKE